jgi:serine/arginine repetitive matrix protein 2
MLVVKVYQESLTRVNQRMYNGIGLRTTRGSGTNGFVQKNLSFIKPKRQNISEYKYDEEATAAPSRKPSDEVLLLKSRRQIENELIDYEESLQSEEKYL